jgi:hypothetical protein
MSTDPLFARSLDTCVGLFTLSNEHADWLREKTGVVVSPLIHPTEIPEIQFSFDSFIENKDKRLLNVGYWLRKVNSIFMLPIDSSIYTKTRVLPFDKKSHAMKTLGRFIELEKQHSPYYKKYKRYDKEPNNHTETLHRISNEGYDAAFSRNIVFLDMYDSSANNAIIESIARATPILVNPLPSIVEYLGRDYPFYFDSLEEAASKAVDFELVRDAHLYLLHKCETRNKLSQEYFRKSLEESEVYKLI